MMLFLIPIVSALPICPGDDIPLPCTVVTYSISCSNYTYTIFNGSGSAVKTGNMSLWNAAQYSFILANLSSGRYMIRLCTNASREVTVMSELTYISQPPFGMSNIINLNEPSGIAIIFILLALWLIIFIAAFLIRSVAFMLILGIYTIILGMVIAFTVSIIAGSLVTIMGLGFMGLGALFMKKHMW